MTVVRAAASAAALHDDAWLSGLMGVRCRHLSVPGVAADIPDLAGEAGFIDAKAPAARVDLVNRLEDGGFRLIDVNLRLVLPAGAAPAAAVAPAIEVRFAQPGDRDGVAALARGAFRWDRFHRDPHIPPGVADSIKAAWAANFFAGARGDWMVTAVCGGTVAGFLQLLGGSGDGLTIDLIATGQEWRGRGVARAMIAFAAAQCRPGVPVITGTQAANEESLRLYQRMGFQVTAASYILHRHTQAAAVAAEDREPLR